MTLIFATVSFLKGTESVEIDKTFKIDFSAYYESSIFPLQFSTKIIKLGLLEPEIQLRNVIALCLRRHVTS